MRCSEHTGPLGDQARPNRGDEGAAADPGLHITFERELFVDVYNGVARNAQRLCERACRRQLQPRRQYRVADAALQDAVELAVVGLGAVLVELALHEVGQRSRLQRFGQGASHDDIGSMKMTQIGSNDRAKWS